MNHVLSAHRRGLVRARVVHLVAVLLCVTTAATHADVLISNLPGNDLSSTFMNAPSGGSDGGGVHDSKAAGFTMPAGSAYFLDYVDLRVNYFNTSSVPVVQIYSDVAGNPGMSLTTLVAPPIVVGTSTVRFTPGSSFTLDPNTTYWAVVWNNATVPNSFQWLASNPSATPTGLATTAGYRFSNGPPPPTGNSTTFNSYEVGGTLVPEPASGIALIACVVCAACVTRQRRHRRV